MSLWKKLLLLGIVLLALIVAAWLWIETDAKRVHRVLQACETAAREANPGLLMEQIADDYDYEGMDRATLDRLARSIFRANQFSATVLYNLTLRIEGDVAEARFTVLAQPASGSALPGSMSGWRLQLRKRDGKWVITQIELVTLNGQSAGTLRQMMEQAAVMSRW